MIIRNPLFILICACFVLVLVTVGHYAGLKAQDNEREELRRVVLYDIEDEVAIVDGRKVTYRSGSFQYVLQTFRLQVTPEMEQDYWKVYDGKHPPQLVMSLYLSHNEIYKPGRWDFTYAKAEHFAFLLAFVLFVYTILPPAVIQSKRWDLQ